MTSVSQYSFVLCFWSSELIRNAEYLVGPVRHLPPATDSATLVQVNVAFLREKLNLVRFDLVSAFNKIVIVLREQSNWYFGVS